jgi:hypothetical protein
MILLAFFLVLVLALARVQATQGWFSAMIMAILTISCSAPGVGSYDYVGRQLHRALLETIVRTPDCAGGLFGVPLILLRLHSIARSGGLHFCRDDYDRVEEAFAGSLRRSPWRACCTDRADACPSIMGQSWDIRGGSGRIRPRDKPSGMEQRICGWS